VIPSNLKLQLSAKIGIIDGSDFEILDLIAGGSQQHQATPEYVNKPGCTHLGPSLPTP
jgi:hypothetical protein